LGGLLLIVVSAEEAFRFPASNLGGVLLALGPFWRALHLRKHNDVLHTHTRCTRGGWRTMALNLSPSRGAIIAFGTVSFFMTDDKKTIRVDVGQELLKSIEGAPPRSNGSDIERCERHKRFFAQLAARKYQMGQYVPEVRVLVVRITEDDLT
jgi:hypothetical protein